jgi:ABC-type ATPase involved in cell division
MQLAEHLFHRPSVAAELAEFGAAREACPALLGAVGLGTAVLAASPFRLSGGELRRLALAAGLAGRRPVLVADEPEAGLDGPGRRGLFRLLRAFAGAGGTVVVASHDPELLAAGAPRLQIAGGRLEPRLGPGLRAG